MRKIAVLFVLLSMNVNAQVNIGAKNDRYISTSAITINPSAFLQNPNPWEVNLVSADLFLQNNYAFITDQSLLGLSKAETLYNNNTTNQQNLPKNTIGYGDGPFNGYFQTDILGPALAVKFKIKDQQYAAGFYTRVRSLASAFGIDQEYRYVNFVSQPSFMRYFKPFEVNAVNLQENAVFLSRAFKQENSEWQTGITIKQSRVLDAFILRSNQTFRLDYNRPTDEVTVNDYDFDVYTATSYDDVAGQYKPSSQGTSYGADVGVSWVDYGNYDAEEGNYKQKISFSITDIGFVKIKGQHHHYMSNPFTLDKDFKFTSTDNIYNFYQQISDIVYDNPNSSLMGNSFNVALPTALHLSYSGNLSKNNYLTLGLSQRIPLANNSFKTANVLYANYGKSNPQFSYAAQVSLFEYKRLQIGGYLRWGPFFVGSDHLLPLAFNQKRFDSFDFYFGIKIYPFWNDSVDRRTKSDCNCN